MIDVARVHQHCIGQRSRLCAIGLVGLIEQGTNLGIAVEHDSIEMRGQRFATRLKDRYGGFDDVALGGGEHDRLQEYSGRFL